MGEGGRTMLPTLAVYDVGSGSFRIADVGRRSDAPVQRPITFEKKWNMWPRSHSLFSSSGRGVQWRWLIQESFFESNLTRRGMSGPGTSSATYIAALPCTSLRP